MNIIELAEQAGLYDFVIESMGITEELKRFAELVAAAEREACADHYLEILRIAIDSARKGEREACAKAMQPMLRDMISRGQAAEIIRARGDKHD